MDFFYNLAGGGEKGLQVLKQIRTFTFLFFTEIEIKAIIIGGIYHVFTMVSIYLHCKNTWYIPPIIIS
jgi:hypothetical protein